MGLTRMKVTTFQILSCSCSQCLQDRRYEDFTSGSTCPSVCTHNPTVSAPQDLRFHYLRSCFTGVCIDEDLKNHFIIKIILSDFPLEL